jgi:hypothetical protein
MSDYEKYRKYKSKYVNLKKSKKQYGGASSTKFPVVDEIHFWGRQMMEHAFFLYLGLENESLKSDAHKLYQKWENFMDKMFYTKINVAKDTVFLTEQNLVKLKQELVEQALVDETKALINETSAFKENVIKILGEGEWIGWIYPSLAKHMLQETEYFYKKINGQNFTTIEEISFSNNHHSGELAVTAQLIDPNPDQQPIIDIVRSYALKKMSTLKTTGSATGLESSQTFPKTWTPEEEAVLQGSRPGEETNLLILSLRFSEELAEFAKDTGDKIKDKKLESVISPVLANHVHREFVRFTETLRRLTLQDPQIT